MSDEEGLVRHRRRPRHGRGHRAGGPRRRSRGRGHRPQPRAGQPRRSARTTTCWPSPSTSPTRPARRPPCDAAVDRFGRIDVLVNNAGNFYAGFFEEITPEDFRAQVETNLFGPLNVTRAVLPVMRAQRSGLVVTICSTAGLIGQEFCTAYAASKFALEGWMESLTPEVAPFGIRTMLVEPGFFRTDLLTPESTSYAEPSIDDYAERTRQTVTAWNGMNGLQGGDPAKLAAALVQLAGAGRAAAALGRRRRRRRRASSRRRRTCSPRSTPTASCPRRWPTTTPRRTSEGVPASTPIDRHSLVAAGARFLGAVSRHRRNGSIFVRATLMYGAGDVRVENVPDPTLQQPTDALVRVVRACVCGSDLHPYHSMPASAEGSPMGHEFIGVVEETGVRGQHREGRRLRHRAVRLLRQHLRVLPRGPAHLLPARRLLLHGAGRGGPRAAGRRHPRQGPGRRGLRAAALAADAVRRPDHRPPRRRDGRRRRPDDRSR